MASPQAQPMAQTTPSALPLGRKVPRGTSRWYLVRCPEGREQALCEDVRRMVSADLVVDAFVPRREREGKYHGEWRRTVAAVFPGYFVVVTTDAPALARELAGLTLPVCMAGAVGRGYAPVAAEAQDFLTSVMDEAHVVRFSQALVTGSGLRVTKGPLVGRESRVRNFESRKRYVRVRVCEGAGGAEAFTMPLPMVMQVVRS